MNLPPIIGAYAAIRREQGRPFAFPGGVSYVWEAVDTRLVADAIGVGRRRRRAAAGETFNLTNGEVFEWRDAVAGAGRGPRRGGRCRTSRCASPSYLPANADVWDRDRRAPRPAPDPMADLLGESHHYADFCFAYGATEPPPPTFVSTVKIQQAGFTDALRHRGRRSAGRCRR